MKLGILTDSTSDIPQTLIERYGIEVVPTILILDGREYADGIGISRAEFYTRLPDFKSPPTTAAPSIGEFQTRYQKLFDNGCDHILSIHPAVQLTAIINSARQAAQEFGDKVTCVDSGSLSLGLGFQVIAAAEMAESSLTSAREAIESTRKRLTVNAALDTMEYLKRSGRVPGLAAALGGILSIKPMIELTDGEVKPIGAVRTTKQGGERMLNSLLAIGKLERLAILHTNAEPRARELLNEAMQSASQSMPRDVLMVNVTAVIGTHLGPNGLGFAAIRST